jgi:hypothetical protein
MFPVLPSLSQKKKKAPWIFLSDAFVSPFAARHYAAKILDGTRNQKRKGVLSLSGRLRLPGCRTPLYSIVLSVCLYNNQDVHFLSSFFCWNIGIMEWWNNG